MTDKTQALWEQVREALELLGKFEKRESLWPDGPHVFAGATADALRALAALREQFKAVEQGRDYLREERNYICEQFKAVERDFETTCRAWGDDVKRAEKAEARVRELEGALRGIAEQQPKTLAMIERNGFVFDSIGHEPGNWQHLAFTIYTDLCEVDTWARNALGESFEERLAATDTKGTR